MSAAIRLDAWLLKVISDRLLENIVGVPYFKCR